VSPAALITAGLIISVIRSRPCGDSRIVASPCQRPERKPATLEAQNAASSKPSARVNRSPVSARRRMWLIRYVRYGRIALPGSPALATRYHLPALSTIPCGSSVLVTSVGAVHLRYLTKIRC